MCIYTYIYICNILILLVIVIVVALPGGPRLRAPLCQHPAEMLIVTLIPVSDK